MNRPCRSTTLTGTETKFVSTRITSPSDTSSGPASTTSSEDVATGVRDGAVPAHCGGRAGRCGSSPATATVSTFGCDVATRRGREPAPVAFEATDDVETGSTGARLLFVVTPVAGANGTATNDVSSPEGCVGDVAGAAVGEVAFGLP